MGDNNKKFLPPPLNFKKLTEILPYFIKNNFLENLEIEEVATRFQWKHCIGKHAKFYTDLITAIAICFSPPVRECNSDSLKSRYSKIKDKRSQPIEVKQFLHDLEVQYQGEVAYYELTKRFVTGKFYQDIFSQETARIIGKYYKSSHAIQQFEQEVTAKTTRSIKASQEIAKAQATIDNIKSQYEDNSVTADGIAMCYVYNSLPFEVLRLLIGPAPQETILNTEKEKASFSPSRSGSYYQWINEYIDFVLAEIKQSQLCDTTEEEANFLQAYLEYWQLVKKNLRKNQQAAAVAVKNWLVTLSPSAQSRLPNKMSDRAGNVLLDVIETLAENKIVVMAPLKKQAQHSLQKITQKQGRFIGLAEDIVTQHGNISTKQKLATHQQNCAKINALGQITHLAKYYDFTTTSFEGRAIASHIKQFLATEKIVQQHETTKILQQEFNMPTAINECEFLQIAEKQKKLLEKEQAVISGSKFYAKSWKNKVLKFFNVQSSTAESFFAKRAEMIEEEINFIKNAKKRFADYISSNIDKKITQDLDNNGVLKKNLMGFYNFVKHANNDACEVFEKNSEIIKQITLFMQSNNLIKIDRDNIFLNHIRYQRCQEVVPGSVMKYFEKLADYARLKNRQQYLAIVMLMDLLAGKFCPKTTTDFLKIEQKLSCLFSEHSLHVVRNFMIQFTEKIIYPLKKYNPHWRVIIQQYAPYLDNVVNATEGEVFTIYRKYMEAVMAADDDTNNIVIKHMSEKILMCAREDSIKKVILYLIEHHDEDFIIRILQETKTRNNAYYITMLAMGEKTMRGKALINDFFLERWKFVFPKNSNLFSTQEISENDDKLFGQMRGQESLENILRSQFEIVSHNISEDELHWNQTLSGYIRAWGSPALIAEDQYQECVHVLHKYMHGDDAFNQQKFVDTFNRLETNIQEKLLCKITEKLADASNHRQCLSVLNALMLTKNSEIVMRPIEIYVEKIINNTIDNSGCVFTLEEQAIANAYFNNEKFAKNRDQFLLKYLHFKNTYQDCPYDEVILQFLRADCKSKAVKWQLIKNLVNESNDELLEETYDSNIVPLNFFDEIITQAKQQAMPPQRVLVDMQQRAPEKYVEFFKNKLEFLLCHPSSEIDLFLQQEMAQFSNPEYLQANPGFLHYILEIFDKINQYATEDRLNFIANNIVFHFVENILETVLNSSWSTKDNKNKASGLVAAMADIKAFCRLVQIKLDDFNGKLSAYQLTAAEEFVEDLEQVAQNSHGEEKEHALRRADFFRIKLKQHSKQKNYEKFVSTVLLQAIDFVVNNDSNEAELNKKISTIEANKKFSKDKKIDLITCYLSKNKKFIINILIECKRSLVKNSITNETLTNIMQNPTILEESPGQMINELIIIFSVEKYENKAMISQLEFYNQFMSRYHTQTEGNTGEEEDLILNWVYCWQAYHHTPSPENEAEFQNAQLWFSAEQNKALTSCSLSLLNYNITEASIVVAEKNGRQEIRKILHYAHILQDNNVDAVLLDRFNKDINLALCSGNISYFVQEFDMQKLSLKPSGNSNVSLSVEEIKCAQKFTKFVIAPVPEFCITQQEAEIIFSYFRKVDGGKNCLNSGLLLATKALLKHDTIETERAKFFLAQLINDDLAEFKQYCQDGIILLQQEYLNKLISALENNVMPAEILKWAAKINYPESVMPVMIKQLKIACLTYIKQLPPEMPAAQQAVVRKVYFILGLDCANQEKLVIPQFQESHSPKVITGSPLKTALLEGYKRLFL